MTAADHHILERIDELNARLAALERRAAAKTVTDADRALVAAAHRALEALAAAYVDGDASERRLIQQRAGFDPRARRSLRDIIRRRLTWFPKRRGDYREALWFAALTYADDAREAMTAEALRLALAALCIEGGRRDDRDTIDVLGRLRRSAAKAGIDPEPFFQQAAEWVGHEPIAPNRTLTMRALLSRGGS